MEESFFNLVENFDSQLLEDYRNKIRTNIYKEIDKLRKNDEFSKRLEREELCFWFNLLVENNNSNLNNLVLIYDCSKNLKFFIDRFKELVNTN